MATEKKKISPEKQQKKNILGRHKALKRKHADRVGLSVADFAWKDGKLYGCDRRTGEILGLVPNIPSVPKFHAK